MRARGGPRTSRRGWRQTNCRIHYGVVLAGPVNIVACTEGLYAELARACYYCLYLFGSVFDFYCIILWLPSLWLQNYYTMIGLRELRAISLTLVPLQSVMGISDRLKLEKNFSGW